jgi:cytochrome c553
VRVLRILALAAAVVLAGCGGSDDSESQAAGAKVFADAGCGGCHTLAAAGSTGAVGPSLDGTQLSADRIATQVRRGGNGMPSFDSKLSDQEIADVASYVASSAADKGGSVATTFKPDKTELADCDTGTNTCLEQAFGNVSYGKGPKAAVALLETKMDADAAVLADCHRIVHSIGAAALARYKGNVAKAFAEGSATCGSGYYHGLIERAFVGVPDDELGLSLAANRICSDEEIRRVGFISYQCVHGLGHGLMLHTGYDLPKSLRVCDDLEEQFDQVSCTGGVFMENANSSYGTTSKYLKSDDLIYPCNEVATRHKYYCYLLVTSRILPAVGGSLERTAKVCRQSEPDWVDECFESFGRDASGIAKQVGDKILPLCRIAGANEDDCIYGAARDIANNDAAGERAARFCEKVKASARAHCFEGVGTILGGLHTYADERRAACAAVTTRYLADCARGAGIG